MQGKKWDRRKRYKSQLIASILKNEISYFRYINWDNMPFSKSVAYKYELNKDEEVLEAFETVRSKLRGNLYKEFYESKNPMLKQIAFKLIAEPEDLKKLGYNNIELTTDNLKIEIIDNLEDEKNAGS